MELGQKLKQARLEAGLSQRQLCGDIITRNMLSQIENGSARPSYATLQALCARLGKPVSYFREEAPSENLSLLYKAAQATPRHALAILSGYLKQDPLLDPLYYGLLARCLMQQAEQALDEDRGEYARQLLLQAEQALEQTRELPGREQLVLLLYRANAYDPQTLVKRLPDNTQAQLLRAQAALEAGDPDRCVAQLVAAEKPDEKWKLLFAKAQMGKAQYEQAAQCLLEIENSHPQQAYPLLEQCYRELGDFEKAYFYACKQR